MFKKYINHKNYKKYCHHSLILNNSIKKDNHIPFYFKNNKNYFIKLLTLLNSINLIQKYFHQSKIMKDTKNNSIYFINNNEKYGYTFIFYIF